MTPIHASPALKLSTAKSLTEDQDVFGPVGSRSADPANWPFLSDLVAESVEGALDLENAQKLPQLHIGDFGSQPCLFHQAQVLEPGAEVDPHRDAIPMGGDKIATLVLEGSSNIKVGSVVFTASAGDLYALTDHARYDIDHEVAPSFDRRLSMTWRYGLDVREGWDREATQKERLAMSE